MYEFAYVFFIFLALIVAASFFAFLCEKDKAESRKWLQNKLIFKRLPFYFPIRALFSLLTIKSATNEK